MDDHSFDLLARRFAGITSRRTVVKSTAGAVAAGVLGLLGLRESEAATARVGVCAIKNSRRSGRSLKYRLVSQRTAERLRTRSDYIVCDDGVSIDPDTCTCPCPYLCNGNVCCGPTEICVGRPQPDAPERGCYVYPLNACVEGVPCLNLGDLCCDGQCILSSDAANCGACGHTCSEGDVCFPFIYYSDINVVTCCRPSDSPCGVDADCCDVEVAGLCVDGVCSFPV